MSAPPRIDAPAVLRSAVVALSRGVVPNAIALTLASVALITANLAYDSLTRDLLEPGTLASQLGPAPFRFAVAAWVVSASAAIALDTHERRAHRARDIVARSLRGWITAIGYEIARSVGLAFFILPGLSVMSARSVAVPAAIEEQLRSGAAWDRSDALSKGNYGVVLRLSLIGIIVRMCVNMLWPDTAELSERLGGNTIVWYALAFVHQVAGLATCALDGSIAAAFYVHLRSAHAPLDATQVATVFD